MWRVPVFVFILLRFAPHRARNACAVLRLPFFFISLLSPLPLPASVCKCSSSSSKLAVTKRHEYFNLSPCFLTDCGQDVVTCHPLWRCWGLRMWRPNLQEVWNVDKSMWRNAWLPQSRGLQGGCKLWKPRWASGSWCSDYDCRCIRGHASLSNSSSRNPVTRIWGATCLHDILTIWNLDVSLVQH